MKRFHSISVLATGMLLSLSACATSPVSQVSKAAIPTDSEVALAKAQLADPGLRKVIENSAGYAVFADVNGDPTINRGGPAKGTLYEYGTVVGSCSLKQSEARSQSNGRPYIEVITFATEEAVYNFKHGNVTFDDFGAAVPLRPGVAANARQSNGVTVFTIDPQGRPYDAVVAGQKFNFEVLNRTRTDTNTEIAAGL